MTFAAIDWLSISINLLLVIFVVVCLMMTLLILMQRPKQEGLGAAFGAGVTDQVFGARTTNVLQRGTVYLGSLFFVLALALAVLIGHKNKNQSLLEPVKSAAAAEEVKPAEPAVEVKPKSLSEELPPEKAPAVDVPALEPALAPALESTPAVEPAPVPESTPAVEEAPADTTAPTGEIPAAREEKSGQP